MRKQAGMSLWVPGSEGKKNGNSRERESRRAGTNRGMAEGPSEMFEVFQRQIRKKSGDQLNAETESKKTDPKTSCFLRALCNQQGLSGVFHSILSNPHT